MPHERLARTLYDWHVLPREADLVMTVWLCGWASLTDCIRVAYPSQCGPPGCVGLTWTAFSVQLCCPAHRLMLPACTAEQSAGWARQRRCGSSACHSLRPSESAVRVSLLRVKYLKLGLHIEGFVNLFLWSYNTFHREEHSISNWMTNLKWLGKHLNV